MYDQEDYQNIMTNLATGENYDKSRMLEQAEADGKGKLSEELDFSESSRDELMGHVMRAQKQGLKFYELRARDALKERFGITIWP